MVSAKRAHLFKNLKLALEIKARTEIYRNDTGVSYIPYSTTPHL